MQPPAVLQGSLHFPFQSLALTFKASYIDESKEPIFPMEPPWSLSRLQPHLALADGLGFESQFHVLLLKVPTSLSASLTSDLYPEELLTLRNS